MHIALVDLGVVEDSLDGLVSTAEEVLAMLLEASTGDGSVEVDTPVQRVDLNGGLGGRREGALSPLASSVETTGQHGVGGDIWQDNNK